MYKLFYYIIFCISFFQADGQNSSKHTPQNKPASLQNKSSACCNTIEQFKDDLYGQDSKKLREKYRNKSVKILIDTLNDMLRLAFVRGVSQNNVIIKNKGAHDTAVKPSIIVRLQIIDSDSISNIPLKCTITFDSTNSPIFSPGNINDDSKNPGISLVENKQELLIIFKEPKSKIAPDKKDSNTSSQSRRVVLLVIGGLCCIIGMTTWRYGRLMLAKARLLSNTNVSPMQNSNVIITAVPIQQNQVAEIQVQENQTPDTQIRESQLAENQVAGSQLQENQMPENKKPESLLPENQPENNIEEFEDISEQLAGDWPAAKIQKPLLLIDVMEDVISRPVQMQKYFFAEIMSTSGPRNKDDKDLGEDVCGFVADGSELLVYLLDGTSEADRLVNSESKQEYFSSRLLAQCLANKLRLTFTSDRKEALETTMSQAIEDVKKDWLFIINNLPEKEKARAKKEIEKKGFQECSTTVLVAQLSINGQITVYRSGDSKMFLFKPFGENKLRFEETPLVQKNDQSYDRTFFQLKLNANKEFYFTDYKPRYEIIKSENTNTIIIFSDGIGALTEQVLEEQYGANSDEVRKEIMYQKQGTLDDKSICFVSIRENRAPYLVDR